MTLPVSTNLAPGDFLRTARVAAVVSSMLRSGMDRLTGTERRFVTTAVVTWSTDW